MKMKIERKDGKMYIYVKDPNYEVDEWVSIVDEATFEWCVQQKKKAGEKNPVKSALMNYAYGNDCYV